MSSISKTGLHPRNIHKGSYDLNLLSLANPELKEYIFINSYGNQTLDFSNPKAVKALNRALLYHDYQVKFWDIPDGFLCPPIPGRADYIHYLADILAEKNKGNIPKGQFIQVLDIGTGANLIYPLLGHAIYSWSFIGSEIELPAYQNAQLILRNNPDFSNKIKLLKQDDPKQVLIGVIHKGDYFDLTLCNPPFHESAKEAQKGTQRKNKNLNLPKDALNFGGKSAELWYEGGEKGFISQLIQDSQYFKHQVFWFSSLVSKESNLKALQTLLRKSGVAEQKVVTMYQGNKKSRLLAWTYLSPTQQENWRKYRWK